MPKPNSSEVAVLQDWRTGVDKTLDRIETKIDGLDKKFASKTVERIVYALIWVILLYVANLYLGLIKIPTVVVPGNTDTTHVIQVPQTSQASPSSSSGSSSPASTTPTNTNPNNQSTSPNGGVQVTLPKTDL